MYDAEGNLVEQWLYTAVKTAGGKESDYLKANQSITLDHVDLVMLTDLIVEIPGSTAERVVGYADVMMTDTQSNTYQIAPTLHFSLRKVIDAGNSYYVLDDSDSVETYSGREGSEGFVKLNLHFENGQTMTPEVGSSFEVRGLSHIDTFAWDHHNRLVAYESYNTHGGGASQYFVRKDAQDNVLDQATLRLNYKTKYTYDALAGGTGSLNRWAQPKRSLVWDDTPTTRVAPVL